ncbi:hypothetical protein ACFJ92_000275 [Vibrio parahaemolyticus]|nr:hypothetical protein [Vibrio parahaemolyticus]ELR9971586.1 hypothetical protein [Vibrio parahaemolyticus]MBE3737659.1 hypothetical protein [Vibrio parahaemolyticus]HCG8150370.1 hypothetical protein [Vibrio parahaemolyticus]
MKKRNLALLILLFGSTTSLASVMDPDCDAEKAAKAVDAMTPEKEKKTVKDVTKKLNKD